jgi:gliding motility-associated-like protein
MSRTLPVFFRSFLIAMVLFFSVNKSHATHVVGGDIYYAHLSGLQYRITVVLYGDCGSTSGVFPSLHTLTAAAAVCIYDGATLLPGMPITLPYDTSASTRFGTEITPVCEADRGNTKCTNISFPIAGIKKFVYQRTYTLPYASANWRFVFNGNHGSSSAGRATTITNIAGAAGGGSIMELTATLNNTVHNNTSPSLTVVPTPFFCLNTPICYTPGAIDPEGDSLRFDLIPAVAAAAGCAPGTAEVYIGTAWPGTPVSATTPLRCAAGSYSFNTVNGQVCFNPNFIQRGIVVYNVSEYRDGILVGTVQREMTFLVQDCPTPVPVPGLVTDTGVIIADGPTTFHVCGNEGNFALVLNPIPGGPTLNITATATGLPPGVTFTVLNNGTPNPTCTFAGNATLMAPGVYTFFLNLRDDACPLNGNNTVAYTISIYPVPAINATIVTDVQCTSKAVINAAPGGQGSPWTIKVKNVALLPPSDTVATYTTTVPVLDFRDPGTYVYIIFTNVSTECSLTDTVTVVAPPRLLPTLDSTNPSHCGKNDGEIVLLNLNPGGIDTITYDRYGVPQPPIVGVVSAGGIMTISGLRAGVYSNIVVRYGYCTSLPIGPITLVDPPFTLRATTYRDPVKCGFCDGWIKLDGLHPDQLDTVTYNKDGVPQAPTSFYITSDSTITLPGLCEGIYTTFNVRTAGVCTATLLNVVTLAAPPIRALFDTLIKPGCKGDTLILTNNSFPASDLTYFWEFGDGGTSTEINPIHVYTNTVGASYTIKLTTTNTKCVEDTSKLLLLNHFVNADFSMDPPKFLCQIDSVTFTNLSTGTDLDYRWYFADGRTDTTTNIVHSYRNMGTYSTMLVAHNVTNGVHCYDTAVNSIIVDSNSVLTLKVSDDVTAICRGQAVTLSAIYTNSGTTGNAWTLTDGFNMNNINPLKHSFEGTGPFTVNFNAKFRACPEKNASLNIHVFDVPGIYLGADTSICTGGSPILLRDDRNATNPRARWRWNTDETIKTAGITVTKPGMYAATVTVDGCSMTDTIIVTKDCYVEVPNVFTPNGDGVNDYFFPRRLLTKSLATFNLSIYNRWGQLIYETANLDGQGWDGAMNGTPQPTGVYIYSIEATFKDGMIEQHKGNVTLLR